MAKESCTDITIRNIPRKLLAEFDEKIVKELFPGGRAEAIRDLMRKAIQEQHAKEG